MIIHHEQLEKKKGKYIQVDKEREREDKTFTKLSSLSFCILVVDCPEFLHIYVKK